MGEEKKKEIEKKNTWKKIYFCTKVILSLACVLCSFPSPPFFLLWAVIYVVEKAYSTRQEAILQVEFFFLFLKRWEESSALAPFGNCVAFTLPFSTPPPSRRHRTGMSSLIIIIFFCLFLKGDGILSLWVVLMFFSFMDRKKRLLKKNLQTKHRWFLCRVKKYKKIRSVYLKHTKTGFIETQIIALHRKTHGTKIQVDWSGDTAGFVWRPTVQANLEVNKRATAKINHSTWQCNYVQIFKTQNCIWSRSNWKSQLFDMKQGRTANTKIGFSVKFCCFVCLFFLISLNNLHNCNQICKTLMAHKANLSFGFWYKKKDIKMKRGEKNK